MTPLSQQQAHAAVLGAVHSSRAAAACNAAWCAQQAKNVTLNTPQGFRTVDGTSAAPLALDPLARLSRLVSLDLEYTGEWLSDRVTESLGG